MKKMFLSFAAILILAGCNAQKSETVSDNSQTTSEITSENSQNDNEKTKDGKLSEIFESVKEAVDFPDTGAVSENNILNRYGVDTESLEEYVFEEAETGELFVVLKCSSQDNTESIRETLEAYKQNVLETAQNYDPEQFAMYKDSILDIEGNYVYWIVCKDPDTVRDIVLEKIK